MFSFSCCGEPADFLFQPRTNLEMIRARVWGIRGASLVRTTLSRAPMPDNRNTGVSATWIT